MEERPIESVTLKLLLTAACAGSGEHDLVVECDPGAPQQAVVEALATRLRQSASDATAGRVERTGALLGGERPIGEADLRDGDRVVLCPDGGPADDSDAAQLLVTGGPAAGRRLRITPGRPVTVGRGPEADVEIADPRMSRRHLRLAVADGHVLVEDLQSSNGTRIDDQLVRRGRLAPGALLQAGSTVFILGSRVGTAATGGRAGPVAFNRPPRVAHPRPGTRFQLPAPPSRRPPPPLPVAVLLFPLVLGAAMYALTRNPYLLMVALMTPALALSSTLATRRQGRRVHRLDAAQFASRLGETCAAVAAARAEEVRWLQREAPGVAQLLERAERHDPALWERRAGDADFLRLRVGVAPQRSGVTVELEPGGDPAARAQALERVDATATLEGAPVLLPPGGTGLVGQAAAITGIARWLVAQAAALHSPADLAIGAILTDGALPGWQWLKWLPHVREASAVALGDAAASAVLRRAAEGGRRWCLIMDGRAPADPADVADALAAGASVVWLGDDRRGVPSSCRSIVEVDAGGSARVTLVESGEVVEAVTPDVVEPEAADALARSLAPLRDGAAREGRGDVPARVSLLGLLGHGAASGRDLAERWSAAPPMPRAPLGVAADGAFVVEAGGRDGLRMLVAGMPGAGKSELLQSLVAGLAASTSPARVNVLLVDYKGGAAFRDCGRLPHTVGVVTDLDAQLAVRARVSLLAELRRREALLADRGARNLEELSRLDPHGAPPALVIVVDEFATLARELPSFVDTVVDVAQRGRSLGLHLVLATQRPRGAVSEAILATTTLRVALRLSDPAESRDVIDSDAAAGIPRASVGRAIALTGRGHDGAPQLVEFQTAYAAGSTDVEIEAQVTVSELRLGRADPAPTRIRTAVAPSGTSDLERVVAAAAEAAVQLHLPAPRSPWLPPLPDVVRLADLEPPASFGQAVVGLLDLPEVQSQRLLVSDLDRDGPVLLFGTGGSGRTTALRTVALSLAERSGPEQLWLYGLDFGGRDLADLEHLPQCGSVVPGDDGERVRRLLRLFRGLLARRRREGWSVDQPRVVLLLDGYEAFAATYERAAPDVVEAVSRLASEGGSLGLHVVLSAGRRAAVPGALAGVAGMRLVLRLADEDEYAAFGIPRSMARGPLPPGRGHCAPGHAFQVAVVDEDGTRQGAALRAAGRRLADRHGAARAPSVGVLPEIVRLTDLPPPPGPLHAVLGIGDDALDAVAVDLREDHFLVAGPLRSGRSTALMTLAAGLRVATPRLELHLLAPRRTPLTTPDWWNSTAEGADACADALRRLEGLVRRDGGPPALVVVDDVTDLGEAPGLDTLARLGRDLAVRIVAAVEVGAARRSYAAWLRELRSSRQGLLLQPEGDADSELLGARLRAAAAAGSRPGRGHLVAAGTVQLVQVAMPPPTDWVP